MNFLYFVSVAILIISNFSYSMEENGQDRRYASMLIRKNYAADKITPAEKLQGLVKSVNKRYDSRYKSHLLHGEMTLKKETSTKLLFNNVHMAQVTTIDMGIAIPWKLFEEIVYFSLPPHRSQESLPIIYRGSELISVLNDLTNLARVNKSTRLLFSNEESPFIKELLKKLFLLCFNNDVFNGAISLKKKVKNGMLPCFQKFLIKANKIGQKADQWNEFFQTNPQEALKTLDTYNELFLTKREYTLHILLKYDAVVFDVIFQGVQQEKIHPSSCIKIGDISYPLLSYFNPEVGLNCSTKTKLLKIIELLLDKGADIHQEYYLSKYSYDGDSGSTPLADVLSIQNKETRELALNLFNKYNN